MATAGASRQEIQAVTGQTVAVRDMSFDVERGETFVVMGLSGSGKSTLIRCLSRLIEPTSGTVRIDGEDVTAMDAAALRALRRTKLSMVFQHFGLFPHRRVIDNVAYGLEVQRSAEAAGASRLRRCSRRSASARGRTTTRSSCRAGCNSASVWRGRWCSTQVLFFDEPFSALDPLIRRDMQDELCAMQLRRPRTMVFITHDFDEALRLGDRIAIMKDGVLDQVGTPEEVVADPATSYVREFTTHVPQAEVLTAQRVMGAVRTVPAHRRHGEGRRPDPDAARRSVADRRPQRRR